MCDADDRGQQLGATVFCSYAGFNVAYALIFIPGTGVLAAYTDAATGKPLPELNQALALLVWAWFLLTVIFTVAAMRSSWTLLLAFVLFDLETLLLAAGYTVGNSQLLLASRAVGFPCAFLACECLAPFLVRIVAANGASQIGLRRRGFGAAELPCSTYPRGTCRTSNLLYLESSVRLGSL